MRLVDLSFFLKIIFTYVCALFALPARLLAV